jgi:hypothetical protein
MAKYVELRRHTDAGGDVLKPEGVRAAVEIGSHLTGHPLSRGRKSAP